MQQYFQSQKIRFRILFLIAGLMLSSYDTNKVDKAGPKKHVNYLNTIGMEFAFIPAGTFKMGANGKKEEAYRFEIPRHKVTISKPFYLGRYEVTQAQWEVIMGYNPSNFKNPNNPAENITIEEVQQFIQKLNDREKVNHYRLPTEAEWEYAARAGSRKTYFFGDMETKMDQFVWYEKNSGGKPHPVGQKKPNAWGLYDVLGNINEYVQDKFSERYYTKTSVIDPTGPDSGTVLKRGGSWFGPSKHNRLAFRDGIGPAKSDKRGFRLLLTTM
jgi:formylglycine-generating enzyme required for sulfatase activity